MNDSLEIKVVVLHERGIYTLGLEASVAGFSVSFPMTPDQARSFAFDLIQRATDADEKTEEIANRRVQAVARRVAA